MTDTEHVVAIDDSIPSLLVALGDIGAAQRAVGRSVDADLDLLIALCTDSPPGSAFLSGGAAGLIDGIRNNIDALTTHLTRIDAGLSAGARAINAADEAWR